jgi:glycosyltransferase involved in cell wall biosynthesis
MLTIWNGIPDTEWRANPGASGMPVIAVVARMVEQKDQRTLIRALPLMHHQARVLFAGDGPHLEELQKEAFHAGVHDRVEFMGRRLDVERILSKAHIFALPSKWEGFPLSILEAMRAGLPVVASDVGGVSEAVDDGRTGFLIPRGDASTFAQKLDILAGDPFTRRRMGNAGRKRYEEQFTLKIMLQRTMEVYRKVASTGFETDLEAPSPSLTRSTSKSFKLYSTNRNF